MKKIFIVLLLILFTVSFANAQDQPKDISKIIASVSLGGAMPMGDFKDVYKLGFGGSIDAAYAFNKNIAGRLEITVNDFMLDKDKYYTNNNTSSNLVTVTGGQDLVMATKLSFCGGIIEPAKEQKFSIYGIFSIGVYLNIVNDIVSTNNSSNVATTSFGGSNAYMGVGAGFRMGYKIAPRASLFLEAGYETFFPSESWGKASLGTRDDFIPVKIGVMVHPF